MRPVYLSPHLDDAALSCGGWIHSQSSCGVVPLVITCCAGVPDYRDLSPFAQEQHQRWHDPEHPVETRRDEDALAMACIGADYVHLDLLDCIYRRNKSGEFMYQSDTAIFGSVHEEDDLFVTGITERLRPLLTQMSVQICAPLGVGHHVDHQLVRRAALLLRSAGFLVEFYEDYPYARDPLKLQEAFVSWLGAPFPVVRTLAPTNLEAKVRAVCLYRSQLATLFGKADAVPADVRDHAARVGGGAAYAERYWLGGR
jgi:LmbE family N-acetylglucosaminyl deacetylase